MDTRISVPPKSIEDDCYSRDAEYGLSPCGTRCAECSSFFNGCKGCHNIEGKVHWLQYTGDDVCPIWKCCKERNRKNCGGCPELPCVRYMKDPTLSDEENEANLRKMLENLQKEVGNLGV